MNAMELIKINNIWQNLCPYDLDGEVWECVPYYKPEDGVYASNMGRIKTGHSRNRNKQNIRVLDTNNNGYPIAQISRSGVTKTFTVHKVIGLLFVPNPNNLPEVNHKWGVKWDNRATELEWGTRQDNIIHARDVLGHFCGIKNHKSKFSEQDVIDIFYSKDTHRNIATKYGVSHNVVGDIKRKKSYKDILNKLIPIKKTSKSGRLFDDDVISIFKSQLKRKQVCDKYKISKHIYHAIKSKKSYLEILKSA